MDRAHAAEPGRSSAAAKPARYRQASYRLAAHQPAQMPPDQGLEVAFAGRSNAGKSSAINRLTERKRLARTSNTPGRTRQIVFFDLDHHRRLVDLPGYGYAKVPAQLQDHWRALIGLYLEKRAALRGLVIVMDCRHPLKPYDGMMLDWLAVSGLPGHVILTKSDKLPSGKRKRALQQVHAAVPAGVTAQLFSAQTGLGLDALRHRLDAWFEWASGLE